MERGGAIFVWTLNLLDLTSIAIESWPQEGAKMLFKMYSLYQAYCWYVVSWMLSPFEEIGNCSVLSKYFPSSLPVFLEQWFQTFRFGQQRQKWKSLWITCNPPSYPLHSKNTLKFVTEILDLFIGKICRFPLLLTATAVGGPFSARSGDPWDSVSQVSAPTCRWSILCPLWWSCQGVLTQWNAGNDRSFFLNGSLLAVSRTTCGLWTLGWEPVS